MASEKPNNIEHSGEASNTTHNSAPKKAGRMWKGYVPVEHDKRRKHWRSVKELTAVLEDQFGPNLTESQRARIADVAELIVVAQTARRRALEEPTHHQINAAVRSENLAQRALNALSAALRPSRSRPGLQAYLKAKGAA